ncbi:hypothetical protein [Prolixibacter denitrificans]|uniref:Uncharacterized protein n=1 Tax=Prolixibacter denitrificans TaxID=1541063 RepID=A0A2P8C944_9BACT|nr:hypothetical protein [Prolixibacter denitrificans]PSK81495.1 hypothetical protein CLV93_109101 [Prolixibacter denitrificans]GET21036.1 hypothetical protein JCM18694_12820 [Prolixibacter denitrificans]
MYLGEPKKGLEFYKLLNESEEFTSELGRVTLASGKLEAELIILLKNHNVKGKFNRATLGSLIDLAETNHILSKNTIMILKDISRQRNYITHNIYALFVDLLDETILEKNNLMDTDVLLYIERAWQLTENIDGLADIIRKENNKLKK